MESNKIFLKELYSNIPSVEDILGVAKFNVVIDIKNDVKEEKYATPILHFMVYKKKPLSDTYAYECACLELGEFHVLSGREESKKKDTIRQLIKETADMVAEYIRLNVLQYNNDAFKEQIQSDFMDGYWRVYRLFTFLNERSHEVVETKTISELQKTEIQSLTHRTEIHNSKEQKNSTISSDRSESFLTKLDVA